MAAAPPPRPDAPAAGTAAASIPKVQNVLIDEPSKWAPFDQQARASHPDRTLIAFDAEWHNDTLCLVQVAFTTAAAHPGSVAAQRAPVITVFTIDVLQLPKAEVRARLQSVLCDVRVRKLCFDCREDCRMLQEQLGLPPLAGLFDLQLFELMTRDEPRPRRIYNVRGLKAMLSEFQALAGFIAAKAGQDLTLNGSSAVFMERPLSQAALDYASCDVASLFTLFSELQQRPTYRSRGAGRIADQVIRGSITYSTLSMLVPVEFRRHNMLPLAVLDDLSPAQGRKPCAGCTRPVAAPAHDYCVICHAHSRRDAPAAVFTPPAGHSPQREDEAQASKTSAPPSASWSRMQYNVPGPQ